MIGLALCDIPVLRPIIADPYLIHSFYLQREKHFNNASRRFYLFEIYVYSMVFEMVMNCVVGLFFVSFHY